MELLRVLQGFSGSSYSFREGTVSAIIGGNVTVTLCIATSTAIDSVVILTRENTYTGQTSISKWNFKSWFSW